MTTAHRNEAGGAGPVLHVLGPFSLHVDEIRLELPGAGQRVIALLAVVGGSTTRSRLAGTLWPDHPEARALSNLRAAVWRLPPRARDLVERHGPSVCLATTVRVDLHEAGELAHGLLDDPGFPVCDAATRGLLARDLLPGVDEDWVVGPREQHRQQRLHALESLAERQLACGRALDAVDTALTAVAAEPLRESAQSLVVRAHLAAGNRAAALRHFEQFRHLLATELDVGPSPELVALVATACGRSAGGDATRS